MRRLIVICLVVIAVLLNLPAFTMAVTLLHGWFQEKTQSLLYFDYAYLAGGLTSGLVALLGILPLVYSLLRRTGLVLSSLLAIAVGLITMIILPEFDPGVKMNLKATRLLGHADKSLALWDDSHGRFPKDEAELLDALRGRPLSEAPIFYVDKRRLEYGVKFIPNATKPYDASLPDEPGILVMNRMHRQDGTPQRGFIE